jgi:uncharacterized protein (TIRG00374 family)
VPQPSAARRIPWHTLIIGALTVGLVWWFLRSLDLTKVWHNILSADPRYVAACLGATVGTYLLRAWRWQALLTPIAPVAFRPTFRTTVIGFAANFMLPGRVGEVLRAYLLARSQGFSAVSAFATVIVERILDLTSVLLLFAWFLIVTDVPPGTDDGGLLAQAKLWGGIFAGLSALGLGLLAIGAGHPERLSHWVGRLTAWLPARINSAVIGTVRTLVEGLAVMRRPGPLAAAFGLTLLLWLSIAASIWFGSRAFGLTFDFTGSFLVMAFLTVGVSLPTPAGLGGFQWAYQLAVTRFFSADENAAGAAVIVLHAVTVIPVCIIGLIFMAQDGLSLRRLQSMRSTAEQAEHLK